MFGWVSNLERFENSRYEALEEVVSLLRSKGVNVESVLHVLCKADYCHLTFEIGDASVTFDTAGLFGDGDDGDSVQKVIKLSLEFCGGGDLADMEWSYKYSVGELEILFRMLEGKRHKWGKGKV